jgi:hypothetical protein
MALPVAEPESDASAQIVVVAAAAVAEVAPAASAALGAPGRPEAVAEDRGAAAPAQPVLVAVAAYYEDCD